ncbi:ABC transporter ATP-binding protein [Ottowia sp. VDI28]|uniref:ABC transporter ATP-binding protein n=1 Tax=Ottowia sp. VDI28 TaxID=3133968 RepID=UPI003C2E859C
MNPAEKMLQEQPLLEVQDIGKQFGTGGSLLAGGSRKVRAVDGVSFSVWRGETLGLVGESGSGKSTTARLVLRLIDPTAGRIRFGGMDITTLSQRELRPLRRRMQMVFQDPFASLDPRMTVRQTLEEPLIAHGLGNAASRRARVDELLELVKLSSQHGMRYPHEFSGGQRQRVGIARALALEPDLIVCDEAVSALDVSIQAQVINLLKELQARLELSYLFIAHDLAVVKHIADRVAVMYLGRLMEIAPKDALFAHPRHPYTRMLLAAVPAPHPDAQRSPADVRGDLPSPSNPLNGCPFHTRCPFVIERCRSEVPALLPSEPAHLTACHRQDELPEWQPVAVPQASLKTRQRLALYAERRSENSARVE